ncbi:uncharacterized protein LOC106370231 [Brassica napus]|uniref:uncharacterized protein LOC106370231 n=1 Tax=Brassica napus TaxID=3708 RepID=UPI0006AA9660|nr:uncharacterized protein LOC106370231 [Brassica napus]
MFISHEYVLFSTCTSPTKDSWYLGPIGNIIYNNKNTAIFNYECVVESCETDWTKPIPSILRLSSSLTLSSLSFLAIIDKFVKRYGKTKLERAIELFEHAVSMAPSDDVCQNLIPSVCQAERGLWSGQTSYESL